MEMPSTKIGAEIQDTIDRYCPSSNPDRVWRKKTKKYYTCP
jgi:hypothetical protein